MRRFISGIIVGAILSTGLLTAQKRGQWTYGVGNESCGKWLESRNPSHQNEFKKAIDSVSYLSWVLGFISGAGWDEQITTYSTDPQAIWAAVDKECRENPNQTIESASQNVFFRLMIGKRR